MTHFYLFRTLATGAAMMGKSLLTGAALLCAATTLQAQNKRLGEHRFFYHG